MLDPIVIHPCTGGSAPVVSWDEIETNGTKYRDNASPGIEELMNGWMVVHLSSKSSRSRTKNRDSEQTNRTQTIHLSFAKPFLKPTLPLLAVLLRLHIRRGSLSQMTIGRRRARRSATPPRICDGRRRGRETLPLAVHVRATAIALVAILDLGALVEPLLLQSVLLQLVHGAVQAARVC